MKFLYTADFHFSSYSQDRIDPLTHLPERLSGIYSVTCEMINYAIDQEIKYVVVGGDVFHNKSLIHSIAQSKLLDIIRVYKMIKFIILDGNHDMSSMTGDGVSATKSLDNEENVTTIHRTTKIENILFVPWDQRNMIFDIKEGNSDYLISHFGLNEAKLNSGISIISDIGLKDLKQYKHCFLGHYHTPQSVGNVTYVGSPIQLDWGEKNEEKRFLIINSETGDVESIPTVNYKKHFEFIITSENKNEIIKNVIILKNQGHYVKLNRIDDSDLSDVEKTFEIIDKREKDITNRGITSGMTRSDKLDRYLDIKEIPLEKREKYKSVAVDIMDSI
jgi:DNA repair exonuclease SbcCD nuclease subunit